MWNKICQCFLVTRYFTVLSIWEFKLASVARPISFIGFREREGDKNEKEDSLMKKRRKGKEVVDRAKSSYMNEWQITTESGRNAKNHSTRFHARWRQWRAFTRFLFFFSLCNPFFPYFITLFLNFYFFFTYTRTCTYTLPIQLFILPEFFYRFPFLISSHSIFFFFTSWRQLIAESWEHDWGVRNKRIKKGKKGKKIRKKE